MERRVVVSGLGVVASNGIGREAFFDALVNRKSGIGKLTFDRADPPWEVIAARVDDRLLHGLMNGPLTAHDRVTQMALISAKEALQSAGLLDNKGLLERAGVYLGTGFGGAQTLDDAYFDIYRRNATRVSPATLLRTMNNAIAAQLSISYGLRGPSQTYSSACASSAMAIGEAARAVRHGYAPLVLAGGAEALLTYGSFRAWQAMHSLAVQGAWPAAAACRPFSSDRTGLVLGEGAGMVVLEAYEHARARGATIYGELVGYGVSTDGDHLTRPCADGQSRAMKSAIEDSGLPADAIGYVNAHGTATRIGDVTETQAIKNTFGKHAKSLAVSSTKSLHGHTLGAAGALEFVVTVLAVMKGVIPPTAHLTSPDPECDLDFVAEGPRQGVRLEAAMSNSFAFGGQNAALIVAHPDLL